MLCANITSAELSPLVYQLWPNHSPLAPNDTNWPVAFDIPGDPGWVNTTVFDDLFSFGPHYNRTRPIFPKFPMPYNTLLNSSAQPLDSIYLLAGAPDSSYTLCSLRMSITPSCSTTYNVSSGGGFLKSRCEERSNPLMYTRTHPEAPIGLVNSRWNEIAKTWATALALNDGIGDFDAANSRLLTQLIPTSNSLNSSLPSIAEALAVLSGCTLILSSTDAPFDHYWNNSVSMLSTPGQQEFHAVVRSQQYISGGQKPWQNIFYIVLIPLFVLNCFCLVFFFKWLFSEDKGLIIDVTEPQNTFAMAVNSPQSQNLAESRRCEPSKEQYRCRWSVRRDRERDHYYISSGRYGRKEAQWEQPDLELLSGKGSPAITVSSQL